MSARLNRSSSSLRIERKYYLIVCGGEQTEPNYFESLKMSLPRGVLSVRIERSGVAPFGLVRKAIGLREDRDRLCRKNRTKQPYDRVWIVFDKDEIKDEEFNFAITRANENGIACAYSNEAFELWYLMHFAYHSAAEGRRIMSKKLSKLLGRKYMKNDKAIYIELLDKQPAAIKNSTRLDAEYQDHDTPASCNPRTLVYKLVEELNQFKVQ